MSDTKFTPGGVVHRTPVPVGFQEQRSEFSIWHEADAPFTQLYEVVGTGHKTTNLFSHLVATVVMPDGFHAFHLVAVYPVARGEA